MSSQQPFIHLRCPTEFSLTHSSLSVKDAVRGIRSLSGFGNKGALSITDDHAMFGLIRMAEECKNSGVKPIYGVNLRLYDETLPEYAREFEILFLIKNKDGFLRLSELLSHNYAEPCEKNTLRRIDARLLTSPMSNKDLIVLSGAEKGDVGKLLAHNEWSMAAKRAQLWASSCETGEYVLELQRYGNPRSLSYNITNKSLKLAYDCNLPVVATHPIEFYAPEDYTLNNLVSAISKKTNIMAVESDGDYSPDQYFRSGNEMTALFADIPSALTNTRLIAAKCNYTIETGKNYLPRFQETEGMSETDFLRVAAERGLQKRLAQIKTSRHYNPATFNEKQYWDRLDMEIGVIQEMGFPGYFLIVSDFIRWAKANRCPVGPGRGSGAGSLVAYALEITSIDPIPNGLLFERFLNPERVSMPDFDVDFCRDNRDRVIDYVRDTYGHEAVSQIATFLTLKSKSAVKDVARALGMPFEVGDLLTKNMPGTDAKPISVAEAFFETDQDGKPVFGKLNGKMAEIAKHLDRGPLKSSPYKVMDIVKYASRMEKQVKAVGMHAGGVVIAPHRISDFSPLYRGDGEDARMVSMFDKNDIEKAGLVKFDFLGLKNMTVLQFAEDELKRTGIPTGYVHEPVDFDDPEVYRLLSDGNTTGVFQVESPKMKQWLRELQPREFESITAMLALYRPGPINSGMLADYVERKKACDENPNLDRVKAGYYLHEDLAPALESTYGIMVYQEQVMAAGRIMGGYTLGGADILRRAMGKKKADEMQKQYTIFMEGAAKKGYPAELADQVFKLMEKFADYGFNKSHSAAYAVITYQTAFLKAHHPEIFYAASLSQEYGDTDHIQIFLEDAQMNGVDIREPDINTGEYCFRACFEGDKKYVTFGLGALKGINRETVDEICAERQANGPFSSLEDFLRRIPKKTANKRVLESLIKAGAFDNVETRQPRSEMITRLPSLRTRAEFGEKYAAYLEKIAKYEDTLRRIAAGERIRKPAPPRPPKEKAEIQDAGVFFDDPVTLAEYEFASFGYLKSKHIGKLLADCFLSYQSTTIADMVPSDIPCDLIGFKTDYFEGSFIGQDGKPVERGRLSITDGSGMAGHLASSIRADYDTDETIRKGLRLIKDRTPIVVLNTKVMTDKYGLENLPSIALTNGRPPKLKTMVRPKKIQSLYEMFKPENGRLPNLHFVIDKGLFMKAGGKTRLLSHPAFSDGNMTVGKVAKAYVFVSDANICSLDSIPENDIFVMDVSSDSLAHLSSFGAWLCGSSEELEYHLARGRTPLYVYQENTVGKPDIPSPHQTKIAQLQFDDLTEFNF